NRELVLSALADDESVLHRPLRARDTQLMADATEALGSRIQTEGNRWRVSPRQRHPGSCVSIDCGLAGTVMRFAPILAALADGGVAFDGDSPARLRPMSQTIAALRALGIEVTDNGRCALPMIVHGAGSVDGGTLEIDSGASSQFISALLLAAPAFKH